MDRGTVGQRVRVVSCPFPNLAHPGDMGTVTKFDTTRHYRHELWPVLVKMDKGGEQAFEYAELEAL